MTLAPDRRTDDVSKDRLRLWIRLLKATRMIEADLRERLRTEFGTTLPRFDLMAALHRHEAGLKMSQLSGVLRVSNGNVTGLVDRLAADGMLSRSTIAGDRRAALVRLTDEGRIAFEAQAKAHERWIHEALDEFDSTEAQALAQRLVALTASEE